MRSWCKLAEGATSFKQVTDFARKLFSEKKENMDSRGKGRETHTRKIAKRGVGKQV
jgi:hypothetical protein